MTSISKEPCVFKFDDREAGTFKMLPISYPLKLIRGESICIDERMSIALKDEPLLFNDSDELNQWIDSIWKGHNDVS